MEKHPFDVDVVADIFIGRAVKISRLLNMTNEEWPDFPGLPSQFVTAVELEFERFKAEDLNEFYGAYPRFEYLTQYQGTEEMPEGRLKFETEMLVKVCLQAWRAIPMDEIWPVAEKILKEYPELAL